MENRFCTNPCKGKGIMYSLQNIRIPVRVPDITFGVCSEVLKLSFLDHVERICGARNDNFGMDATKYDCTFYYF